MSKLTKEMKDWLGDGEWDIDLMIRMGLNTEEEIYQIVISLIDSPWYEPSTRENKH